jgi:hypothetical protein
VSFCKGRFRCFACNISMDVTSRRVRPHRPKGVGLAISHPTSTTRRALGDLAAHYVLTR